MPAQVNDGQADVRVAVAPLMEIESAICGIVGPSRKRDGPGIASLVSEQHTSLAERFRGFWPDGHVEWIELFVILERAGLTLCPDPAEALNQLPNLAARSFRVPPLPSEEAATRRVAQSRIDALAGDEGLRREYASILLDLWGLARGEWEAHGRATAETFGRQLEARIHDGEPLTRVLPAKHLALNDAFHGLIDGGDPIVVTPLSLNTSLKYILQVKGRPVYIGFGPASEKAAEGRAPRVEAAASAFKVFSDPTRLAILEYFQTVPASVSDLARVLSVSQPTISAHVKILRDAGLLTSTRKGSHTLYRANREAIQELLERSSSGITG